MEFPKLLYVLVPLLALGSVPAVDGFRVLGLFPYPGRSHMVVLESMMAALASRGHEVVVLSAFPLKNPVPNYTDVDISHIYPSLVNNLTWEDVRMHRLFVPGMAADLAGANACRTVFGTQQFQDIMSGVYGKFDVVFTEIFGSDCWTAVPYRMKVPLISMLVAPDYAWMHDRVGSVDNPSYLIVNFEPYAGAMNLLQRIQNTFMYIAHRLLFKFLMEYPSDEVVREHFGADMPPLADLVARTSLVMVNTHVSVNAARPVNPNVIHVGGMHLKDRRPDRTAERLDPDLRKWMDEADQGVIFFTLGSMVRVSSLPRSTIEALVATFAALGPQYRVLWKYEKDDLVLPSNVRTASWVSGVDVLAHPKVVLFMTHGGLMSTTEAVFLGVPMLGIPLFADQQPNIALYAHHGIAEHLDLDELADKDKVLATIRKMVLTDKYRVRSRLLADRYWDRPLSPREEAVWWTEYVVRHRGAAHLRPLGADMPLFQYLLLDVLAVALVAATVALLLLRLLVRMVRSPTSSGDTITKKKRS